MNINNALSLSRQLGPWAAALLSLACAGAALAQAASLIPLDMPQRAEKLLEAARKDGTLTVYTAFRPQDLAAVLAPFESKYGIKVKAWRSGTNIVTQRVLRESAAKRNEVDVIMIPASDMEALYRERLLQAVPSPEQKDLMPNALPVHRHWATVFMNVTVHSYNTQLLKKEDLPKTYQDLLQPQWKGNLGVEAKAEEWFAKVVTSLGEERASSCFAISWRATACQPALASHCCTTW